MPLIEFDISIHLSIFQIMDSQIAQVEILSASNLFSNPNTVSINFNFTENVAPKSTPTNIINPQPEVQAVPSRVVIVNNQPYQVVGTSAPVAQGQVQLVQANQRAIQQISTIGHFVRPDGKPFLSHFEIQDVTVAFKQSGLRKEPLH